MSLNKGIEIAKKAIEAVASTQMVVMRVGKMFEALGDLTVEDVSMEVFIRNNDLRESFLKSGIPDMSHINEPKDKESLAKIEHYIKGFLSICYDIIEQNTLEIAKASQ